MEGNHLGLDTKFGLDEGSSVKKKWHLVSNEKNTEENDNGSFDCNICFDSANDPVVTLCGHLYCWPCIYKWLHLVSEEGGRQEKCCPVCKSQISIESLVPLYGRRTYPSNSDAKNTNLDLGIPCRPGTSITSAPPPALYPNQHFNAIYNQQNYPDINGGHTASLASNHGGTAMASIFNPSAGMLGETVYARIFGTSEESRLLAYPYRLAIVSNTSNQRVRRQEMHLEKALNRVSIFMFFCIVLCLIIF